MSSLVRRKGQGGGVSPLDCEIWCFSINVLVDECFSLSFDSKLRVGKMKFYHCWTTPGKSPFGHPLEKSTTGPSCKHSFRHPCLQIIWRAAPKALRGVWCAGLFCNAHVFTTNFGLSRNCYFYCTTPICLQHTAEYRVLRIIADLQSHVTNCDVIMKLDFDHKTCRPIVLQPALT